MKKFVKRGVDLGKRQEYHGFRVPRRSDDNPEVFNEAKEKPSENRDIPGFHSVFFGSFAGFWVCLEVGGICCLSHSLTQEYQDFITILAGLY
ncbi:hypothetical protein [Paenibacillus crassostreae]|nr:hypothetical protein [Paenibacillus crassostreae]